MIHLSHIKYCPHNKLLSYICLNITSAIFKNDTTTVFRLILNRHIYRKKWRSFWNQQLLLTTLIYNCKHLALFSANCWLIPFSGELLSRAEGVWLSRIGFTHSFDYLCLIRDRQLREWSPREDGDTLLLSSLLCCTQQTRRSTRNTHTSLFSSIFYFFKGTYLYHMIYIYI